MTIEGCVVKVADSDVFCLRREKVLLRVVFDDQASTAGRQDLGGSKEYAEEGKVLDRRKSN